MRPRRLSWLRKEQDKSNASPSRQRALSTASEKRGLTGNVGSQHPPDGFNEKRTELPIGSATGKFLASHGQEASPDAVEKTIAEDRAAQRIVRTVPAWVRDADEDDVQWGRLAGLLPPPEDATIAQHNHTPAMLKKSARPYSHILNHGQQPTSRWVTFARASAYPREPDDCERVSYEWLNRNLGDYSTPWLAGLEDEDGDDTSSRYHAFRQKQKVWYKRSQDTILQNPLIPLAFRLTVFIFSAVALSLGGSIHHFSNLKGFEQGPSAEMAIIVDVIAMVYTVYITVDEYISKPLGLRSVRAKLRLIFLDLFFIVFEAANLALAFESLSQSGGACKKGTGSNDKTNRGICDRQQALASVLLIALIAWLLTFAVSVLRLVERVAQG